MLEMDKLEKKTRLTEEVWKNISQYRFQQILNENILIKAKKWLKENVDLWRILKATDQRLWKNHTLLIGY